MRKNVKRSDFTYCGLRITSPIFILIGVQTLMASVPKINVGVVCRDALEANVGLALNHVMRKT